VILSPTTRSLVRFHWRAGARVSLRANGIVGAMVVFAFGIEDDALRRLHAAILELVARNHGWNVRLELAAICVALAGVAMPRITLGATGWMRTLPASSRANRRAAMVALCGTQAFAIAIAVLAAAGAAVVYRVAVDPAKLAGIALMIVSAAGVVLPVERKVGALLSVAALGLAVPGRWVPDAVALVTLAGADATSGGIARFRRVRAYRSLSWDMGPSAIAQWIRLTVRTLPVATIPACVFSPVIFIAFAYFIVRHNPDLDSATARRTVRICGALALSTLASALGSSVVRRRPAWPWARSLPWSMRDRAIADAALIGGASIAIPIALLPLGWGDALAVALLVPPIAACASAAVRAGAHRQTSAAGEVLLFGVAAMILVALWTWTCIPLLGATPLLLALARRRDRRTLLTRFEELHHDAGGDSAWVSAS
jgi:hypothetical protein